MKILVGNSPFLTLALLGLLAALCAKADQQWLFWAGTACAFVCVFLFALLCVLDLGQEEEMERRMRTLEQARALASREWSAEVRRRLKEREEQARVRVWCQGEED